MLSTGNYACELIHCYNFYNMLVLNDHVGAIFGAAGMRDVTLDGEHSRLIMNVYGTGGGELELRLLTFKRGSQAGRRSKKERPRGVKRATTSGEERSDD